MTARKQGKLYDKWHRRVEGQIRHLIGQHPEWFTFTKDKSPKGKNTQYWCVNALAKRIVGEIVADLKLAAMSDSVTRNCINPVENGNASIVLPSESRDDATCPSLGNSNQYN